MNTEIKNRFTGAVTIKQVGYLGFILGIMGLIVLIASSCRAEVNLDLSIGQSHNTLTSDGNFYQTSYPMSNNMNTLFWSVGLSGHLIERKKYGLLWKVAYNDFGKVKGENTACYPDGCDRGLEPVGWIGNWVGTGHVYGVTFGLIGEYKIGQFKMQPEAGGFLGRSKWDCIVYPIQDVIPDHFRDTNKDKNPNFTRDSYKETVLTYYYGLRIAYETTIGDIFISYKAIPESFGPLSLGKDSHVFSAGLSIPLF